MQSGSVSTVVERALFVAMLVLLVWMPIPFGSNRPWAMGGAGAVVSVLVMATWLNITLSGANPWPRLGRARWPLLLLALFALLQLGQIWGGLNGGLLRTSDPFSTKYYLLCTLTFVGQFLLTLLLVTSQRRAKVLVFTLVAAGIAEALVAIILLSVKAQYQLFYEDIQHGAQATGTYINRNHLACYLYLTLSMGIGWLVGSLKGEDTMSTRHVKRTAVAFLRFMLTPRMALRLLLVVMVIALVLTRSRMGNASFFAAVVLVGCLVWWRLPALRRTASVLIASLILVDVVVIGQWVGLEHVVQRLEATAVVEQDKRGEETLEARLQPAIHTLPMIAQRPWFGYGGGTFYMEFPRFKTEDMVLVSWFFDHAHNDYAEIAADTGLLGLGLLLVTGIITLRRAIAHTSSSFRSSTRGVAYGVFMALCCIAIHSWVDFNLHIPANAFTLSTIMALMWSAPWRQTSCSSSQYIRKPLP
ncbi:O-antigen ligase family protein [Aquabacterium sp.]|uniref:O-antigen ligase family protein n=1 Tax=Aquabacterium sp. TaxID=1872578 RepID=UPI0035B134CE